MTRSLDEPLVRPFGDTAVLVSFREAIDPAVNDRVHALTRRIRRLAASDDPFGSPVPAYSSVLVPFDPLRVDADEAVDHVRVLASSDDDRTVEGAEPNRTIELPTRYGGDAGPDIDEVAGWAGLTTSDVVELHASVPYRVYMLGFAPGFAYLGRVPAAIATPRRDSPRARVVAGSVGIAGEQTGVYPFESPGGWQLIGRTDAVLWDVRRDPPALLAPGDTVRFVPVKS